MKLNSAQKIKPFTTLNTWDNPTDAMEFYEQHVPMEPKFGENVADFLFWIEETFPEALYNVQASPMTNYLAIARPGDRRAWAFVHPERTSIWVAHERNGIALTGLFPELFFVAPPNLLTRNTRQFVDVLTEDLTMEGAEVALALAAAHAVPLADDRDGRFT